MNKIMLKKLFTHAIFGLSVIVMPNYIEAASATEDECSQEILLSYFPSVFVTETLTKFKVPKDKWDSIKQALLVKDKEIIKLVEAKAAKISPNPLKDPEQRQTAIKLFRETLTENFAAVMKDNGITDEKQIQSMLEDLQIQKAKRFAHCMEIQRNSEANKAGVKAPAVSATSTTGATGTKAADDSDDEDDDSDDSDDNDDSYDDDEDDSDDSDDSDTKADGKTGAKADTKTVAPKSTLKVEVKPTKS